MFGNAYRAIVKKEDGSFKVDGYLIMDRMYNGQSKVDIYSSDLVLEDSRYMELRKLQNGSYATGDCFPNDGRGYILMYDRDMEDLLAMRKALDRLNRLETRPWTVESQGMDVSFCVESISGGKIHIADYIREGRIELRSEHSTLVRHFLGAVNREGIRTPMNEPQKMEQGTYERIGVELCEIANKYDLFCDRNDRGEWCLVVEKGPRENQEILRIRSDRPLSDCIQLSGDVNRKMKGYLSSHPFFTQEDAWSLADDINGLCGRTTPSVIPVEGKNISTAGLQIGTLFDRNDLLTLPHQCNVNPVTVWELDQARLRSSDAMLRDTVIRFIRNLDNSTIGSGEAVRHLTEMAVKYRLDSVRELNGDRLREAAQEAVSLAKGRRIEPIHRLTQNRDKRIALSYTDLGTPSDSRIMMVAEGDTGHFKRTSALDR